jgi:diguanylate cyclase (GGDEF)-like protein
MSSRRRLRHRLFYITALNAVILLGLTLVLTWRARESHREVNRLLMTEGRLVSRLQELQRNQSAFILQWNRAVVESPERIPDLALRYRAVSQLAEADRLAASDTVRLRQEIETLELRLRSIAQRWQGLDAASRESELASVSSLSDSIRAEAERLIVQRQREIDARLPDLELTAEHTMLVALAIVYIIAIFSFVVAKMTLEKVVTPIETLVRATEQIKEGDFTRRVPVSGDHEIAELTVAFNSMASRLDAMTEALRHQASTDELTGLPNFRSFQSVIDGEIERASRYEQPFGVLVFDIDHFKKYNDSWGHLAGNEALQQVSAVIRKALRAVDTPARYGGEEFVAIVPHIDSAGLTTIAERIRRGVESIPPIEGRSKITISVGGAIFPIDGQTKASLFAAADSRLYEAKSAGRNRVVVPSDARAVTA